MWPLRNWGFIALAVAVIGGVLGLHRSASATLAPSRPIVRAIEPGTVSLDWNDVPAAAGYELRYRDSGWNVLPHGDVRVTMEGSSAVVRSLPSGSEYAFSVRTRTPVGYGSNWSDPVYPAPLPARVSPTRALPATPSNLKVAKRERDAVTLEWQAVNSADSYQVAYWRTSEEDADWVILPDEGIQVLLDVYSGTGAVVSQLPGLPEGVHDFAVRAVNSEGVSTWSEAVQAPAFLQTPQDLIGWFQAPGQVVLAWHEVPTADAYEILFWHDLATVSEEWVVLPTDGIEVSLDGSQALVDLGSNHSDRLLNFSVRAINNLSESPWSSIVAVGPVLQVPAELTGRLLEDGAISLDWPDVPVVDAYEVRFLLGGSSESQWVTLPALGIEVSFEGSGARLEQLPYYADYFLQVRATKENSLPSDWSEVFAITRQTSQPGTTVQATSVGITPSGPGTTSAESPTDAEAPPQTSPGSGGGPPGGTSTLETAAEATPTPRVRSGNRNSQPEPTPQPRVWLQGLPSTIEKDQVIPVTLMREGIPAGHDTVATLSVNLGTGTGRVALVAATSSGDPPASPTCEDDPHGYHESYFSPSGRAYIVGCKAGEAEVGLSATVSVSNARMGITVKPKE